MRPRPDAAEKPARRRTKRRRPAAPASMRPRPDAAENRAADAAAGRRRSGFNEAAARCRGKQNTSHHDPSSRTGFNEAAARCRGKHDRPSTSDMSGGALQ